MSKSRKKSAPVKSSRGRTRPNPLTVPSAAGYHDLSPEEQQERDKLAADAIEQLGYHTSPYQFRRAARHLAPSVLRALDGQVRSAEDGLNTISDTDPSTWDDARFMDASLVLSLVARLEFARMPAEKRNELIKRYCIYRGTSPSIMRDINAMAEAQARLIKYEAAEFVDEYLHEQGREQRAQNRKAGDQ